MTDFRAFKVLDGGLSPAEANVPEPALRRGGGGGNSGDMEQRLAALEKNYEKLDGKIDRLTNIVQDFVVKTGDRLGSIENKITAIEGDLKAKADRVDLIPIEKEIGIVGGRVSNLPTTAAMITMVLGAVTVSLGGVAGLAFALSKLFAK